MYKSLGITYRSLGIIYKSLGIMYGSLGIMQRNLGIIQRNLGIMYISLGILYRSLGICTVVKGLCSVFYDLCTGIQEMLQYSTVDNLGVIRIIIWSQFANIKYVKFCILFISDKYFVNNIQYIFSFKSGLIFTFLILGSSFKLAQHSYQVILKTNPLWVTLYKHLTVLFLATTIRPLLS